MRDKHPPAPATSVIATHWAVIIAIVSFSAGAGMSWLILQEQHPKPMAPLPPAFPTQSTGPTAGSSNLVAPDVSQMSPAEAALALGNWHYDHHGWQKAVELYQRAISLGMDTADVRTDLGNALRFSGDPKKALEQYQAARKLNPQHEISLCNMATLYAQVLNDPASAVATWNDYLRLFPNGEKTAIAKQFITSESLKLP